MLPKLNLQIRDHVEKCHGVYVFSYVCSNCDTPFEKINSIKNHFPACKRKKTAVAAQDHTVKKVASVPVTDSLECEECKKNQASFVAKCRKGLVTHMRSKHRNAYEESKTVASKRIAWSQDEDKVLAKLEISLKHQHKGQILDRLFCEWNKIAHKAQANHRSKEAIRGRRQQPEYKVLLNSLRNSNSQNVHSDVSESGSESEKDNETDSDTDDYNTSMDAIVKVLESIVTRKGGMLHGHMQDAIDAFCTSDPSRDPVELSMMGIRERVEMIKRNIRTVNGRGPRKKECRNQSRKRKAERRAHFQNLYAKNKPRLVDEIIDGIGEDSDPPPIEIAIRHYEQIWASTTQGSRMTELAAGAVDQSTAHIMKPVTSDEVTWAIRRTKQDSAKGLDQISLQEIRTLADPALLVAYNIWLGCKRIPAEVKRNRTTLLPKGKDELDKISNWRPITISSLLLRIFNKILCRRLSQTLKTDDRQMGFKPVNGCSMNISWLHHLLKHARHQKRDLYVCLIDVAKAFDSVPHVAIFNALTRNKLPSSFIDLIKDQYYNSSTTIVYRDLSSRTIRIKRGVKQGDPLSPLLFNLVMDELMGRIGDQYGYAIEDIGSTNIKCFADDICLTSGSRMGMNQLIEYTVKFLEEKGLQVNAKKCVTIGLAKGYKGKKSKIIAEPVFSINNVHIPMLGYRENRTKYLGVKFTSEGTEHANGTLTQFTEALRRLAAASLRPHQKIVLLRSYIIPRFLFQWINLEVYPQLLKKIDLVIRQTIRDILHLPRGLSTEFFSIPVRDGGLQIPLVQEVVSLAKVRIYKSIMGSTDNVLKYLAEMHGYPIIRKYVANLQLTGTYEKEDLEQQKKRLSSERKASYAKKVHGYGSTVFSGCPLANTWLHGTTRTMSGRSFINSIKLRTNSLETKVTLTRGMLTDKQCRRCQKEQESIMHVLQFCPSTHGLRCKRHDLISSKVAAKLKERGFTVYEEKRFRVQRENLTILKPDLIAIKGKTAYILDVQIVYETSDAAFINAYQRKVEKYTPLIEQVEAHHDCRVEAIHGLIIGARGSFYHGHLHIWHGLHFNKNDLKYLAINCMENSLRIMYTFWKSTGAGGKNRCATMITAGQSTGLS